MTLADVKEILDALHLDYWTEDDGHTVVLDANDGETEFGELAEYNLMVITDDSSFHSTSNAIRICNTEHDELLDALDLEDLHPMELAEFLCRWTGEQVYIPR